MHFRASPSISFNTRPLTTFLVPLALALAISPSNSKLFTQITNFAQHYKIKEKPCHSKAYDIARNPPRYYPIA